LIPVIIFALGSSWLSTSKYAPSEIPVCTTVSSGILSLRTQIVENLAFPLEALLYPECSVLPAVEFLEDVAACIAALRALVIRLSSHFKPNSSHTSLLGRNRVAVTGIHITSSLDWTIIVTLVVIPGSSLCSGLSVSMITL